MAKLESEVFLLGHWKNFEELEENLTLAELEAILDAAIDKEARQQRFAAALKGINIDEVRNKESAEERFDRVIREAKAKAKGKTEEQIELEEAELGFGFEIEEEE